MLLKMMINLDMVLMVLISIAFLTLLERKILGYIQIRKGPNKVGMLGIFQPFSDALKLFSKENSMILKSNYIIYLISPIMSMMLMLTLWSLMPLFSKILNESLSILMIFCLMSMGVYFLMLAGWSSNSMYSLIGGLRSVAQTISYEVSMILMIIPLLFLTESLSIYNLLFFQVYTWFIFLNFSLSIMFFVSLLAELNRTPFDFAEGESELVSGFNTEYMSGSFAMIFIAEYGMIMFMMFFFSLLFLGSNIFNIFFYLIYLIMLFLIIWIRGSFPRFRYDNLMYLSWKSFLPVSLNFMILFLMFKFYMI
uniref:NADH-ubiquinone oxidoreductase chain 1 n=1 Tax=Eupelmus sp. ZJUH_2016012 TaxID=2491156 RepID=A0A3Q8U9Z5_9HYME|nr:NADH dehydrogenase subunit 1 [Eupelmus sp. ZJUH_2016012]